MDNIYIHICNTLKQSCCVTQNVNFTNISLCPSSLATVARKFDRNPEIQLWLLFLVCYPKIFSGPFGRPHEKSVAEPLPTGEKSQPISVDLKWISLLMFLSGLKKYFWLLATFFPSSETLLLFWCCTTSCLPYLATAQAFSIYHLFNTCV